MTYYLESGITGHISSRLSSYCPGCCHVNFSGWANALDWATWNGGTQRIECEPGTGINSAKTIHRLGIGCLTECSGQPQDDAVEVHFYTGYNATGTLVGKALYVHVDNILVDSNQVYNKPWSGGYLSIGWVPASACGGCYTGAHTHMQSDTGGSLVSGLTDCGDSIACCGTNQYQW